MTRSTRPARRVTRLALAGALLAALATGTTGAVLLAGADSPGIPTPAAVATPPPPVRADLAGAKGSTVPWQQPLTFSVTNATVLTVVALGPDGLPLEGTQTPERWTSTTTLIPGARYTLHAVVRDRSGRSSTIDRVVTATAASTVLHAIVAPGGGVYGVGQPVVVRFDHPVYGRAARLAVLARLQVTTVPAVAGAWRWYNGYQVNYHGPAYWTPGTHVTATATLAGLRVPGTQTWGDATPVTTSFSIGRSFIATVDITAHTLTARRDGVVVRVMNVSTGREKYPTKGGVHIVLVRERAHLYDSATVGIPTASPDGYYETLPWSVRISNAGAFVHANPATVRYQGRLNVSHGCVNASVADAKWFYDNTLLGDVVDVIHAVVPPQRGDAGMSDWNYTWQQWQSGDLDG